jgi:FAD:protein FMN transferase
VTKFEFEAIGTGWVIDLNKELSSEEESSLFKKIKDRIEIFDKNYSRFRKDSLVTQLSNESGKYEMPEDFDKMISVYQKVYEITGGLVTPLIGQVLVDAGYDPDYSLVKGEMTKPKSLNEVLSWEKPTLVLKEPAVLDFGACGKGYLVDIISEILEKEGIKSYCVDASGDMRQRSEDGEGLRVGLEHPEDAQTVIGVAKLSNKSLCGSAGNRRKWADMHHIVNPETLKSPINILSVWVIAETTIISDTLTTCLFFVSPDALKKHFTFEYLLLNSDHTVSKSEGFSDEVFVP